MTSTKVVSPSTMNYSQQHIHHQMLQQQSSIMQLSSSSHTKSSHLPSPSSVITTISPSTSKEIPVLSMMIDRTSFDETDDFNVDQLAKTKAMEACGPAPPVIMKDGKVRRRLRWRPKGMTKRRKPPPPPPQVSSTSSSLQTSLMNNKNGTTSIPANLKKSNYFSSSNSVISQASRHSKKSLHSFASTETACINNQSRRKNALLSSRSTFANSMATTPGSSSSSSFRQPSPSQLLGSAATIGNKGNVVEARVQHQNHYSKNTTTQQSVGGGKANHNNNFSQTSTIFAAADATTSPHDHYNNRGKGEPNRMPVSTSNNRYHRGGITGGLQRPPLFQRPGNATSRNTYGNTKQNESTSTESMSESNISLDDSNGSEEGYSTNNRKSSLIPVPVLSGDEVENERRVDLRIRKSSSFTSQSSQLSGSATVIKNMVDATAILDDGVEPLSIHELRFDEERQDVNPGNSIRRMKTNHASNNITKMMNITPTMSNGPTTSNQSWSSALSSVQQQQDELRFSMSNVASKQYQTSNSNHHGGSISNPSMVSNRDVTKVSAPKARTCPVDVDQGTFLEAEKNLQAIHEMASEHLRQGECAEALEVFEEILRGQLARFGPDHYRVGTALHNIGIVHMRQKDFVRALTVYKEAVRIRKKTLNPFHPDVAASLAQLGVAYMELEKYRKAIGAFREALKIRRICLGNDHPKVAKILNNIGCSLFELNELEVAMVAFEEALDIQRNLLRNPIEGCPVSESSLLSIASTQSNIASIKLYCGHFDEALVDLEEALLIQQCALGDDHPLARRTQESIRWMETSLQKNKPAALSLDLLTQLTGDSMSSTIASSTITASTDATNDRGKTTSTANPNSTNKSRRMMLNSNMFDALLARLDLACGGWDPAEEFDNETGSYHSGDTFSDRSSTE